MRMTTIMQDDESGSFGWWWWKNLGIDDEIQVSLPEPRFFVFEPVVQMRQLPQARRQQLHLFWHQRQLAHLSFTGISGATDDVSYKNDHVHVGSSMFIKRQDEDICQNISQCRRLKLYLSSIWRWWHKKPLHFRTLWDSPWSEFWRLLRERRRTTTSDCSLA